MAYEYFNSPEMPDAISEKLKTHSTSNMNLRSQNLNLAYDIPHLVNTLRKPSIACSMIWNKLPNKTRQLKNSAFKIELKKFFTDKY